MYRYLLLSLILLGMIEVKAQRVERVEPRCWWTGMKLPLQLMLHGERLKGASVRSLDEGLEVTAVHEAESPNYLFVDVSIDPEAPEGNYRLAVTANDRPVVVTYPVYRRRPGSAQRKSFSSADLIYLLMPDRFADGDPATNNTPNTIEKVNRSNPHGRHGGDIQGIIDHLNYIHGLGATAIWPTPLTLDNEPEYSYHGYACCDYYLIDPRFGTNELYREMVRRAHRLGLKIILDAVPNHCGSNHWWMKDLPFRDWIHQHPRYTQTSGLFYTNSDPHAAQVDIAACVDGWFDRMMPDMNLGNPYVLQYMKQMAVWWVEWADLDGIRVDTYPYNRKEEIARWTEAIREEYPHLNLVGECWISSPSLVAYWEGGQDNRDGYDSHLPSVMDFPLQQAIVDGIRPDSVGWGEGLTKIYYTLAHDLVYVRPNTMFFFGDNHDTNRLAYLLGHDYRKVKMALTLLATMRGVPQLYYGTELMFTGDPAEGHGGERIDFPGGWKGDFPNLFNPAERDQTQREVFDHARKLFNWRKTATVVHDGRMMHYNPLHNLYVYFRYTDGEAVMTVLNASHDEQSIDWPRFRERTAGFSGGTEILSDREIRVGEELKVPPVSSLVIHLKK